MTYEQSIVVAVGLLVLMGISKHRIVTRKGRLIDFFVLFACATLLYLLAINMG